MIRKPTRIDRESKAHVAVGRAMEAGATVRDVSARTGKAVSRGYILLVLCFAFLAALTSSTPLWFKAICMLGIGALIRFVWRRFGTQPIR
jgi:hypothetical protein